MIAAWLANHLWQSTLVAGIAWLVTLALRRDRAGVRYGVWLAASLKFLIPLSALTGFGGRFGWRPIVVAQFTPHEVLVGAGGAGLSERAVRIVANQPAHASPLQTFVSVIPAVLVGVWAAGAVVLLATWIVRWRRVSRIARSSTSLTEGALVDALRAAERRAGITRPTRVVLSTASLEPGIFGLVSPVLIWPGRLYEHLSREQVEAILAHEVIHVRRRDNLWALVHLCAQAAFWFHPAVWWIGARLVDERERACDEGVLDAGSERQSYAESILKTCRLFIESPSPCVSGVTGANLKKRIEHIMTNDIRSGLGLWKKGLLAAAASAALAVPFIIGVMTVTPLLAQPAPTNAAFDVTSVKPNNTGSGQIMMLPAANGGWQAENLTLGMLVRLAFQLQDNQIVGGPKWLFDDRFDVKGTGVAAGKNGPLPDKIKTLLVDRFHLVTHVETRDLPVYELVLARRDGKLGEKLIRSDCPERPDPSARGRGPIVPPAPGEQRCGLVGLSGPPLTFSGITMATFARMSLSRLVGRIVIDKTGLAGTYDATLLYTPDPGLGLTGRDLPPGAVPPPPTNSDAPSIFSAVQEQLGLKLEATKGPVDVLVIDSAEKPTAD